MKYFVIILLVSFSITFAQTSDTTKIKTSQPPSRYESQKPSKVYYGGGVGFSFWGDYFRISVEPMVGYKFTPKLSGGLKIAYEYINDSGMSPSSTWHNFGGSVLFRYRIIPQFYAHAEFAYMSYQYSVGNYTSDRNWVPFLLLGGGYSQQIARNTWAYVQVLFDVIQDDDSPYDSSDPFISFGVSVGF
jgi:hypothetical protein